MGANFNQIQIALQKPYDRLLFSKEVLSPVFGSGFSLSSSLIPAMGQPNKSEQAVIGIVSIYGNITLEDNSEITCYEIVLQPKVRIEQNKVAIQRYIRKLLTAGQAALVNFVPSASPSEKKTGVNSMWRLTLVAKDSELTELGIKEKTTHAKRYTYLLGPSETCKTAAERLETLSIESQITFQSLINAFSVEKLSEAFFDEYTLHYQNFVAHLAKHFKNAPSFKGKEKSIRDFTKKLLGRIVFLYFVQKKGWLGATDIQYKDGMSDFMKSIFKSSGGDKTFYSNWLAVLFFETLNQKRANDDFNMPNGKKVKIPFLNGGLFDKEEQDEHLITFKPKLFHNPDNEDAILTKSNTENARGFLDFLNAFNFTVHEDSPDEHTVAVDPEMLGHIFENLLEDNKDKGTFYTPKEIVHYMCQESLAEYLTTHLSKEYTVYRQIGKEQIEIFGNTTRSGQLRMMVELGDKALNRDDVDFIVRHKDISQLSKAQLKHIDQLLSAVKICDPAIGSGAFPMGLLQEIFAIKELIAYELKTDWNPAEIKENIIQKSIYGVDIEKGAVDIARLRFWLSLVVDEEKPRELPNLDYKIVVGDSVVSKFEQKIIEIDWNIKNKNASGVEKIITDQQIKLHLLQSRQALYFGAHGDKEKLKKEIELLKAKVLINQLTLTKISFQQSNPVLGGYAPTAKDTLINTHNKLLIASLDDTLRRLKNSDGNTPLDFFDWKLNFPEVLNDKLNKEPGFDIVIGNPPYGASLSPAEKEFIRSKYISMEGQFDTYMYFIEASFILGKTNGVCSFIIPNNLLQQKYGRKLRKLLLDKTTLNTIIDLGSGVFDNAVVPTAIMNFKLSADEKNHKVKCLFRPTLKDFYKISVAVDQNEFYENQNFAFNIQISRQDKDLIKKIDQGCRKLKDVCELKIGIEATPQYITDRPIDKFSKPLVRGRNFSKYFLDFESDPKYIHYERKLLHRAREERLFDCPRKILIRQTGDRIIATIDTNRLYAWKSVFVILSDETQLTLEYLLALLNSSLFNFYYQKLVGEAGRAFAQVKGINLDKMPVKMLSLEKQKPFIKVVEYIIFLKKHVFTNIVDNLMPNYFERIIDAMVYELYLPELVNAASGDVIKHLFNLPELQNNDEETTLKKNLKAIEGIYKELTNTQHPVDAALLKLLNVSEVNIIEGKQ